MEDEKVKEYCNADLHSLGFKEFCDLMSVPSPSNNDFIDNLEWSLMYLNIDKGHAMRYSEMKEHVFNINTFDGAWLMNVDRLGNEGLVFFMHLTDMQPTINMFSNLNVKTLCLGNGKGGDKDYVQLQKMRLLDIREARHLQKFKYIIEKRFAFLGKNEKWYTHGGYHACIPKTIEKEGKLIHVTVPFPVSYNPQYYFKDSDVNKYMGTKEYREELENVNFTLSVKLTEYYEWFVYIRENEKSLGIKIPIAPESSKDVFALRDIPDGQKRKKAICHFVKEHYRNLKTKPEYNEETRQTLVKQHFRGETKFNWRGLQVNIIPAEYDMNRVRTKKKFIKI